MRSAGPGRSDDFGTTLVELIVYVVLAGLIMAAMGTLFANAWISQTETTNRDSATGAAAVVSASVAQSIRNSAAFEVTPDGLSLRAAVAIGQDDEWECRAWKIVPDDQDPDVENLVFLRSPSAISLDDGGWVVLARDITGTLSEGGAAFEKVPSSTTPFRREELKVGFTVSTDGQAAPISTAITPQAVVRGGAGPCW